MFRSEWEIKVVKADWDQKVKGLDYQAEEHRLYSVDNGELLKVFCSRVTSSELHLRKINLATVRKWIGMGSNQRRRPGRRLSQWSKKRH